MSLPGILIVDDHQIFRKSLTSLIKAEGLGFIAGEASNGKEFLDLLENTTPDLVLMDIDMPVMNGVEATENAVKKRPELKVLALSMFGDEDNYYNMVKAGAKGFILKTCGITELKTAIGDVVAGESYFSNELLRRIITDFGKAPKNDSVKLTERELEVMKHLCNGYSNEEIAETLHISPKTVKTHRASLLAKTQSKNTPGMIIYAIKNRIVEI